MILIALFFFLKKQRKRVQGCINANDVYLCEKISKHKAIDMEHAYTYKGTLYEEGDWSFEKDILKALEYYKKGME